MHDPLATNTTIPADQLFRRFPLNRESGFYKMGHRYYAPTIADATGGGGGLLAGGTQSSDQGVGNN
jgi:hypothetical protein